jgi:hypothetical protein
MKFKKAPSIKHNSKKSLAKLVGYGPQNLWIHGPKALKEFEKAIQKLP